MSDLQENKKNVTDFYDLMFNKCQPRQAIERYAGKKYIQHNPHVGDGKENFIAYFEKMGREHQGKQVVFKRVIAEGNLVVLHCHQKWPKTQDFGGQEYAGMDIFRLDGAGKILEHWDVLQEVPATSAHDNTMF